MKLSIINGTWNLQSLDGHVQLMVLPRRSADAAATQVTLRAEPMPALVFDPEKILVNAPVQAWVWDGSNDGARRIIPQLMSAVRSKLERSAAGQSRANIWRRGVIASLFPGQPTLTSSSPAEQDSSSA